MLKIRHINFADISAGLSFNTNVWSKDYKIASLKGSSLHTAVTKPTQDAEKSKVKYYFRLMQPIK